MAELQADFKRHFVSQIFMRNLAFNPSLEYLRFDNKIRCNLCGTDRLGYIKTCPSCEGDLLKAENYLDRII